MFRFRDKTIWIISPEDWGGMKVSKHHYALTLADQGNKVYYLEPPRLHYGAIAQRPCPDHPGITLVRYKPLFRGRKYLPEGIYQLLIRLQVSRLRKALGGSPDALFCFHGYLFEDLRRFRAPVRIYFAADQFYYEQVPPEIASATLTVAVSDTIHATIRKAGFPARQINHGLHQAFVEAAGRHLDKGPGTTNPQHDRPITVGYTGNLRMEALDRETMRRVIESHPELRFVFWGSYASKDLNLGGLRDEASEAFVRFLQESPQVTLRGVVDHHTLQQELETVDMFWLCWKLNSQKIWDGSNSHKILEYLSTGKPVVSHYVSSYQGTHLLYMLSAKDNDGYLQKFNWVLELVRSGESWEHVRSRLAFAAGNGYQARVRELEDWINNG